MQAIELKTEYIKNPISIDIERPRLSWKVEGETFQSAYQIMAYTNGKESYNTGKVESSSTYHKYSGTLVSRDRITWKVRLWDETGVCGPWSEEAHFEMGFLQESDWKAKWINPEPGNMKEDRQPASYMKKEFVAEKSENAGFI